MPCVAELAGLLRAQRQSLLDHWRDSVMSVDSARMLAAPALIDHVPVLIDTLIDMLECDDAAQAGQVPARGAPRHGAARLADGYDIEEVVAELSILRNSVLQLAEKHGMQPVASALRVVNAGVDRLIAEAVGAYVEATTKELKEHQERHLAFLAHDLRTPLGAISLSLAALERAIPQRNADSTAIVSRMLSSLRRNVARLSRRVEAVLDGNGDGEPHPQPILLRLRPLVADLARALDECARASSTQLENEVPAELELTADPALLGRALENLLVNAIESTPKGKVIIGAAHDGDRVRCWVQDNGEGIAPERLDSIFDVGHSTATTGGHRGLGLAIVRQLVEMHHGQVSVSSDKGGSTFRIDLPATARADGAVNQGPAAAP